MEVDKHYGRCEDVASLGATARQVRDGQYDLLGHDAGNSKPDMRALNFSQLFIFLAPCKEMTSTLLTLADLTYSRRDSSSKTLRHSLSRDLNAMRESSEDFICYGQPALV